MSRLSIIVLLRSESEEFERTLISVLENRPADSEVILVHDGSYADPFELSDEVVFASAASNDLLTLVRAGAEIATSPLVHIIADGFEATPGWTDALETTFARENVVCASPLICDVDEPEMILAAGWAAHRLRVRRMIASGASAVGRLEAERISGLYLAASFWRLSALRRCLKISVDSPAGLEILWAHAMREAHDSPAILEDSRVCTFFDSEDLQIAGFGAGRLAQCAAPWTGIGAATLWFVGCLLQPYRIGHCITAMGRFTGAVMGGNCRRHVLDEVKKVTQDAHNVANGTSGLPVSNGGATEPAGSALRNAA